MKLRTGALTLGLLCLFTLFSEAAPRPNEKLDPKKVELASYAKAFIAQGNITVEIAPYKLDGKEGAILLFKGIESPWDGKAINHGVRIGAYKRTEYVTTHGNGEWVTLMDMKGYDGKRTYELNVPGVNDPIMLAPSDGAAQATTPKAIFDEYQKQNAMKGSSK